MRILNVEQKSLQWFEAKWGVISGSRFKEIMSDPKAKVDKEAGKLSDKATKFLYRMVAEKITPCEPDDPIMAKSVMWGEMHEEEALQYYQKLTGQTVLKAGFCLHDKYDWLGYSPDGFVAKKDKMRKILEVKSPYNSGVHVRYMVEDGFMLKLHKWQLVCGFIVNNEATEADLISYDPRAVIESHRLHIINVKKKDLADDIKKGRKRLRDFRKKWKEAHSNLVF